MKILSRENKGDFIKHFASNPYYEAGCSHQIDIIEGCPYSCSYCFLRHYLNTPDIVIYDNPEKLDRELNGINVPYFNLSVMTDGGFMAGQKDVMRRLFRVLENYPGKIFEIRFKHSGVTGLLELEPPKNINFTATMTTDRIAEALEPSASFPDERLAALEILRDNGYMISVVADPVIVYGGWEADYRELFSRIRARIPSLYRLGMGLLRLEKHIYAELLSRCALKGFTLEGEFIEGDDGKMRYFFTDRILYYKSLLAAAAGIGQKELVLYMESEDVKREVLP